MTTTLIHNTVTLEVDYDFQPYEPETGCYEQITFNTINYKGVNVWEIYYENDLLPELEDLILEQREDDKKEARYDMFGDVLQRMHNIFSIR